MHNFRFQVKKSLYYMPFTEKLSFLDMYTIKFKRKEYAAYNIHMKSYK